MSRIVLNAEQASIFSTAKDPVEVCDPAGKVLGKVIPPKLEEIIAECKRRAQKPGPRYTSEQVRETLRILDETWEKEGPFGEERLRQILDDLRAKRRSSLVADGGRQKQHHLGRARNRTDPGFRSAESWYGTA